MVRDQRKDLFHEDAFEMMRYWYERAVDEQKKELRGYKRKIKAQKAQDQLP